MELELPSADSQVPFAFFFIFQLNLSSFCLVNLKAGNSLGSKNKIILFSRAGHWTNILKSSAVSKGTENTRESLPLYVHQSMLHSNGHFWCFAIFFTIMQWSKECKMIYIDQRSRVKLWFNFEAYFLNGIKILIACGSHNKMQKNI